MYTLTLNNNYYLDVVSSTGVTIPKDGGGQIFNNMGSIFFKVPGVGEINFTDLGDKKIDGYPFPTQTWGVLVRVHTTEAYYRYEGGGELTASINEYGSLSLTTSNGEMIPISLEELTFNK